MPEARTNHFPAIPGLVLRNQFDSSDSFALRGAVAATRAVEPELVSSYEGRIEHLLFALPAYVAEEPLGALLSSLFEQLGRTLESGVSLTVLAHSRISNVVRDWLHNAGMSGASVYEIDDSVYFSIWAEDGYVAVQDRSDRTRTMLIEPPAFGRYADAMLADYAEQATESILTYQVPLVFQGGNVLVGDDFFLIGKDYVADTLQKMFQPPEGSDAQAAMRNEYQRHLDVRRRCIPVGTKRSMSAYPPRRYFDTPDGGPGVEIISSGAGTWQPIFHIDMFISLCGRLDDNFKVLVGDPSMAADLTGEALPDHAEARSFDEIANVLSDEGFEVVRNPLPYTYFEEFDPARALWIRRWYHATANNALVEVDGDNRQVWLPSYGFGAWAELSKTDDANKALWESLGFQVHLLGDFHPLAQSLGSVHCIKKYLRRRPASE